MRLYPKNHILHNHWHDLNVTRRTFERFIPRFNHFAAAGFYFSRGSIHCCSCNIAFKNWLKIKNPLIAHCLLNPHCPFLLREKGLLFVYNITQNYVRDWNEDTFICSVCYECSIDKYLDCGHTFCRFCLSQVKTCPVCRQPIDKYDTNSRGL